MMGTLSDLPGGFRMIRSYWGEDFMLSLHSEHNTDIPVIVM